MLALYKEITGKNLDGTLPKDLQIAKDLLSFIIGQPIEDFLSGVKRLAYRQPITEAEIISPPVVVPSETSQTELTTFSESSEATEVIEGQFETQVKWLNDYPSLKSYRFEASALCGYLKTRETGKYKFKFTIPTVEKNVIMPNASLSKQLFRTLVKFLKEKGYTVPDKSSFKLTQLGEQLYQAVKADNYSC